MKVLSPLILLFFTINLNGQFTEGNFDPEKIRNKIIPVSQKSLKKINPAFPIKDIEIVDARFDSAMGHIKNVSLGETLRMIIKNSDEIKNYFLSHFSVSSSDTAYKLLCVIKKILLSNNIYVSEDGKAENIKNSFLIKSGGIAKLEFFVAIDDMYIPLYRFDSTITGTARITLGTAPDYLSDLLTSSLGKLETIQWNTIKAKARRISRNTIDSTINKIFELSLYSSPVKGVYNNFSDFINNKPSTTEYSIAKTAKADFLYTKDPKSTEILRTDIWGYCDGKDFYIYSAENFFKLHPTGKTFTVYGAKDYSNVRVYRINVGLIDIFLPNSAYAKTKTKSKNVLIHETLLLDMETGELY